MGRLDGTGAEKRLPQETHILGPEERGRNEREHYRIY